MSNLGIDWQHVLGPICDSNTSFSIDEIEAVEQALQNYPDRAVRLSSPDIELPFENSIVPWFALGRYVDLGKVRPGGFLHYAAGDYYIQDAGSMLALALLDTKPGQSICDTCAAPGGKSTGALEQLQGEGYLVANEVIGSRLSVLGLSLARSRFGNYLVTNLEVTELCSAASGKFDRVIVDAPCSGQSMLVRGKQSMTSFSATQIEHNRARQSQIIENASRLVIPGGKMIYSTCTFSFDENEGILIEFLEKHPEWKLVEHPDLANWQSPALPGSYRLWPHRDRCAGAFAAALQLDQQATRENADHGNHSTAKRIVQKPPRRQNQKKNPPGVKPPSVWQLSSFDTESLEWLAPESRQLLKSKPESLWQRGDRLHLMPEEAGATLIAQAVGGLPFAELRNQRPEPHFAAGVKDDPRCTPAQSIALSDNEAIHYIAGQSLHLSGSREEWGVEGWVHITWQGRSLGWGKVANHTLKNHFPKPLRQANLSIE